jgi:hypothetical protein
MDYHLDRELGVQLGIQDLELYLAQNQSAPVLEEE